MFEVGQEVICIDAKPHLDPVYHQLGKGVPPPLVEGKIYLIRDIGENGSVVDVGLRPLPADKVWWVFAKRFAPVPPFNVDELLASIPEEELELA